MNKWFEKKSGPAKRNDKTNLIDKTKQPNMNRSNKTILNKKYIASDIFIQRYKARTNNITSNKHVYQSNKKDSNRNMLKKYVL